MRIWLSKERKYLGLKGSGERHEPLPAWQRSPVDPWPVTRKAAAGGAGRLCARTGSTRCCWPPRKIPGAKAAGDSPATPPWGCRGRCQPSPWPARWARHARPARPAAHGVHLRCQLGLQQVWVGCMQDGSPDGGCNGGSPLALAKQGQVVGRKTLCHAPSALLTQLGCVLLVSDRPAKLTIQSPVAWRPRRLLSASTKFADAVTVACSTACSLEAGGRRLGRWTSKRSYPQSREPLWLAS